MRAEVKTISPALAESMLATSNGNRSIKQAKVAAYRRDMEAGRWCVNGESIVIDEGGFLIDGHHRLKACIAAGVPFSSIVVFGAPEEAQKTIDMGSSRSASDALAFYGYKNTTLTHALVRVLLSLEAGRARSANPSTQEVFDFLDRNPDVADAASFSYRIKNGPRNIRTMVAAVYFLAARDGQALLAERFADVLETGVPAYMGCAAHALRERLIRDELSRAKVSIADRQLLVLSAWEKFRVSAPVKTLKMKSSFSVVPPIKRIAS